ncbi:MAG: ribonuclease HI family protein [Candidatus Neomarinimicrobiota bacterium]
MFSLNKDEFEALRILLKGISQKQSNPVLIKLGDKLNKPREIYLYIDGAADLKSRTAGIGGVFYENEEEIFSFSEYLHDATNNDAEYSALLHGLKVANELKIKTIIILADSELVVKQVNGEYRVKHPRMKILYKQVQNELIKFEKWSLKHVYREQNKRADELSKLGRKKGPAA